MQHTRLHPSDNVVLANPFCDLRGPFVNTTVFAGLNGSFSKFLGSTLGAGFFFTTSDTYGFPDIGIFGASGGTIGAASSPFSASATFGIVAGSYCKNFQGRTDALEFGFGDLAVSAIYPKDSTTSKIPLAERSAFRPPARR